ncbi:protease modulator HflC [Ehrlichia canis]|uniref:Protease FtsH subunit HflC n=1 Tax=Ehrlichia canis (strain Jake) TaxID=269484 RepID=A0ACA6AX06_EHRCJ|nr:protease modulator HflC [Ehrlichia canis]AAZ68875.1 protease FtsH subunit HflC [Ehrlichia canis str. Jake]AUO55082.1 protease modulator HflC [Ehrlichia canis]UKC53365.1 protease modulator HflC [Ehrlichia canis]UKC54301.1 protease modulator HflC [Ehrlichia canis]UKC55237.1 protease modulator HflC [Ehrlichia canis]
MSSNPFKFILGFLTLVIVVISLNSIFIVDEAHQSIVLQFGRVVKQIHNSGLYFKLPFIQKVVYVDKRIIDISSDSREVIAADQKRFIVDSYAKYRIVDPVKFYQTVRTEIGLKNRLSSIIESNIREKIGNVSLINFLNEARSEVMTIIQEGVSKESEKFGIEMIDVRIKRADLPEENSTAIFRRMQTDREKEAKEIRAEGEEASQRIKSDADLQTRIIIADAIKEAQIIRGNGEAKASKIYNDVLKVDPNFFSFYRTMQAYRHAFNGKNTRIILSPNNDFINLFNKERGN